MNTAFTREIRWDAHKKEETPVEEAPKKEELLLLPLSAALTRNQYHAMLVKTIWMNALGVPTKWHMETLSMVNLTTALVKNASFSHTPVLTSRRVQLYVKDGVKYQHATVNLLISLLLLYQQLLSQCLK